MGRKKVRKQLALQDSKLSALRWVVERCKEQLGEYRMHMALTSKVKITGFKSNMSSSLLFLTLFQRLKPLLWMPIPTMSPK